MTEADIFFLVATVQYGDPPVEIPGTDVRVYKGRITNALKWDTPDRHAERGSVEEVTQQIVEYLAERQGP